MNLGVDQYGRQRFYDLTKLKNVDPALWLKQHGGVADQSTGQRSTEEFTDVPNASDHGKMRIVNPSARQSIFDPDDTVKMDQM